LGAAIRNLFQTIIATFNSDLTLHSQNFEISGDLAHSGDFQETLTTIGTVAKIPSKGSYIIIFKRQANGSWQIESAVQFRGAVSRNRARTDREQMIRPRKLLLNI
jgi:ketosteroid isomerase-like protein